jgi:hypothetical protein
LSDPFDQGSYAMFIQKKVCAQKRNTVVQVGTDSVQYRRGVNQYPTCTKFRIITFIFFTSTIPLGVEFYIPFELQLCNGPHVWPYQCHMNLKGLDLENCKPVSKLTGAANELAHLFFEIKLIELESTTQLMHLMVRISCLSSLYLQVSFET